MLIKSKRGSYFVFVTMVFAAMIIFVFALIYAAGAKAIDSTADNLGRLWGRSILAEYDLKLQQRYGLFAFYGNDYDTGEKLEQYAEYSFSSKKYIEMGPVSASLEKYNICQADIFRKQIKDIVASANDPIQINIDDNETQSGQCKSNANSGKSPRYDLSDVPVIKSQRIIKSLPSKGKEGGVNILSLVEKLKEGISISDITTEASDNIYIFKYYKDYLNDRNLGDTFFENEVEYIISGKLDDEKARKSVKTDILLIRNGLNLAYLYTSPEKRQITLAAAELITPGFMAYATQGLIMEVWAAFEASNDMKILYAGKPVPILKKDENWAISLENVLRDKFGIDLNREMDDEEVEEYLDDVKNGTEDILQGEDDEDEDVDYIKPEKFEGLEYGNYLRILVAALPQKARMLRMQDLIQINMKYLYCEYFLLADYFTGVDYEFKVNGRKHAFSESY